MKEFIIRSYNHFRIGFYYMLPIIAIIISIVGFFLVNYVDNGLSIYRLYGILLEIIGLATVVISLVKDYGRFKRPHYFIGMWDWIKGFKNLFRKTNVVAMCGSASMGMDTMSATASVSVNTDNMNSEEKLTYALSQIVELKKKITLTDQIIIQKTSKLNSRVDDLEAKSGSNYDRLNKILEEKATIDSNQLIAGAILTGIGMIITNFPDYYFNKILSALF
jgi:hypothetical protein